MSGTIKLYGVSTGNGNDGVSHMFADYYVWTDQPYRLAEAALVDTFKEGEGMAWAKENVEVDGEAEFTISAVIYNPPLEDGEEPSEEEDGDWCSANGAWLILEVFPVEELDMRDGRPVFDSIESALTETVLKLIPKE